MRVLAVIFGILLLLPGLCFLGFGFAFAGSGPGMNVIGIVEIVVGGLITWGAIAMIRG
jgi:hypothetical protein